MLATDEQISIVKAAVETQREGRDLKIEAGPGTGKTATLRLVAKHLRDTTNCSRLLYLAFNRELANEAKKKFSNLAEVRTLHSLAHHCMRVNRTGREIGRISTRDAIEILALRKNDNLRARRALQTLDGYTSSADDEVSIRHVPRHFRRKNPAAAETAVGDAQGLFDAVRADRRDAASLPLPHDIYLKTWHLCGTPGIEQYETILFDEAQDANATIVSALANHRHVIYVGDEHQQIYDWRGAVDALSQVEGVERQLTLSFRFGPAIAEAANKILDAKQQKLTSNFRLRGNQSVDSRIGPIDVEKPHTRLYRTNNTALEDMIFLGDIGRKPALVGGTKTIVSALQGVWLIHEDMAHRARHPALRFYSTWDELLDSVEAKNVPPEISQATSMVENFQERIPELIERLRNGRKEEDGLALVSTLHKSKGREWPQVLIASDCDSLLDREDGSNPPDSELNLAYVGVTRAQNILKIQSEVLSELID